MRALLIALSCGLAAAAALLAMREGGERREARIASSPAPAPASVAAASPRLEPPPVPAARSSAATSPARAVSAPAVKPPASQARPRRAVFALSSDHQALVHDALIASADYELLENESRDDAWATESERLIRQELARQGGSADFDVIAVDCRQTLCAIEAVSYGENGHREWVGAMDEAFRETLGSVFTSINTAFPSEGSHAPVLTFLHRRPAAPKP